MSAATAITAYSRATSSLHWLSAVSLIGAVGSALKAQSTTDKKTKGEIMFYHKSLGLLTGILLVPRVAAALITKRPGPLHGSSKAEHIAGSAGHLALYAFSGVMAISGISMGYYSGYGLPFFTTTLKGAEKADKEAAGFFYKTHKLVGEYGKFIIPLHVAAAGLHVVRGQAIFSRINPFRRA